MVIAFHLRPPVVTQKLLRVRQSLPVNSFTVGGKQYSARTSGLTGPGMAALYLFTDRKPFYVNLFGAGGRICRAPSRGPRPLESADCDTILLWRRCSPIRSADVAMTSTSPGTTSRSPDQKRTLRRGLAAPISPWAVTLPHTESSKVVIALDVTTRVTYTDELLQEVSNPPRRDAALSDSARR